MAELDRFPPTDWLWRDYKRNAAWYSGEPSELRKVAPRKSFWGSKEDIKLHVPLAADISNMSAALIFADSPAITVNDERTQERIDEIMQKADVFNVLLRGAELASVYGGVFLKWYWDVANGFPRLAAVPADAGMPEWQGGKLTRITLWQIVRTDEQSGTVWRLEEEYTGDGHILSKLRKGDAGNLGSVAPLDAIPETAGISADANSGAGVLLAAYVPNMLPNRHKPYSNFGRSDYAGLYGLLDALDEAYSGIQRESRFTKTTVIVPAEYLRRRDDIFSSSLGETGAPRWEFSNETGVFTALDIDSRNTASPINVVNPEVRAASRLSVCENLVRRILALSGYAPQSAGLDIEGSAESGTALTIRERKSMRTTETKKTYWWHALQAIMRAGLRLDAAVFHSGVDPDAELSIEMPSNSQPDIEQMAQTLEQLERAGAVSTISKVRLLHPDWAEEKLEEEVALIQQERGMTGEGPLDAILGDDER